MGLFAGESYRRGRGGGVLGDAAVSQESGAGNHGAAPDRRPDGVPGPLHHQVSGQGQGYQKLKLGFRCEMTPVFEEKEGKRHSGWLTDPSHKNIQLI